MRIGCSTSCVMRCTISDIDASSGSTDLNAGTPLLLLLLSPVGKQQAAAPAAAPAGDVPLGSAADRGGFAAAPPPMLLMRLLVLLHVLLQRNQGVQPLQPLLQQAYAAIPLPLPLLLQSGGSC